jgi:hypothetical protein
MAEIPPERLRWFSQQNLPRFEEFPSQGADDAGGYPYEFPTFLIVKFLWITRKFRELASLITLKVHKFIINHYKTPWKITVKCHQIIIKTPSNHLAITPPRDCGGVTIVANSSWVYTHVISKRWRWKVFGLWMEINGNEWYNGMLMEYSLNMSWDNMGI